MYRYFILIELSQVDHESLSPNSGLINHYVPSFISLQGFSVRNFPGFQKSQLQKIFLL